ncbi:MAG: SDR family oxidoreductase, partial [Gammaproteobacteria bacterium]
MRVLITGASGQLGYSLLKADPVNKDIRALRHPELDISDAAAVNKVVQGFRPEVIVNAAAYTAVDRAETEFDQALKANAAGPENLAKAAKTIDARLIHISTDFVFDGMQSRPYRPDDPINPLSAYGRSKAEGEVRVRAVLGESAVIVRTGWVYAAKGHNFVNT